MLYCLYYTYKYISHTMYHLIIFSGVKSIVGVQLSLPSIPECFHLPKLKLCPPYTLTPLPQPPAPPLYFLSLWI